MSKLMKWTKVLEGKGIRVIDNTQTIDEVEDGEVKRTHTMPEPTKNGSVVLPVQSEVDAALEASRQAREATYAKGQVPFETEPSDPASFADLAKAAQDPVVAEENLVVTVVEKVFDSTEPQSWDDLVAGNLTPEQEAVPNMMTETPTVYLSLDVPEDARLVIKVNGEELVNLII